MAWLTVKAVSEMLGYTENAVWRKAKKGEFTYHYVGSSTGQGGKMMEILLESLPCNAQSAYNSKNGNDQAVINSDYVLTKAQREKGILRSEAVISFKKYRKEIIKSGITKETEIKKSFVVQWNAAHPDFTITTKTLYEWLGKTKSGNVDKLADKRGGYNRGTSSIPEYYQDYFKRLYLQETKPTVAECFRETQYHANINKDFIPGLKAFSLFAKNIDNAQKIRFREGKKAFDDKCVPYIERDYSLLAPNDYWVSDHHIWDIFVRYPDGKGGWKLGRPWGSYWMDMRTRKMMSSILRIEDPNSDVVLCSFALGVEKYGVPKGVRLDNGKDYKANDLFHDGSDYKAKNILSEPEKEKVATSLAYNLHIEVTYAIPYNAKAKPIERVFNTFESQLGKKYPSYAGSNAKKRPENLKELDIMDYITLDEFIEQHDKYVYEIYNNTAHSGDAMFNKAPNYMYSNLDFVLRTASKEVLYFCLMRIKGTRTVQRNGITFNGVHYYNDCVINNIGKKIVAKCNPAKPELLYIFDQNDNFLFVASEVKKKGWSLTSEDYQAEYERKKNARKNSLQGYSSDQDIRSTESIKKRLEIISENVEQHDDNASSIVVEPIRNLKMEEAVRKINLSDIDKEYEEALKRQEEPVNKANQKQNELAEQFRKSMLERAYGKNA